MRYAFKSKQWGFNRTCENTACRISVKTKKTTKCVGMFSVAAQLNLYQTNAKKVFTYSYV